MKTLDHRGDDMQLTHAAPRARLGPSALAMALALLGLLAMPVPAQAARASAREAVATASAGWHGRAVRHPLPRPHLVRTSWPKGWSAGAVGPGTGYVRPGGSERVRELQRRLLQLGYRPGPVDGLFGPRTRAATLWFQFKHGLARTGRVNRPTLAVLQARSDHKPLRTKARVRRSTGDAVEAPSAPTLVPVAAGDESDPIVVALLLLVLALGLGVIAGLFGPELRRVLRPQTTPAPSTALTPPRRPHPAPRQAPPVLGYAAVESDDQEADTATAALALRCAHRGWSLVEVIHDGRQPSRRLAERPGLVYALRQIRSGSATGLVVARLRDFTTRIADLATLLRWLAEADAFLGAADHELDTSTRAGRATARAIIDLGGWERQRITQRAREDLASGRFTPGTGRPPGDITLQIAAMHRRGISLRAITDALNLAGIATPPGQTRWHTADVKAATEERHRT
jgi:peptidoglycan hydrolase-like protein with peptidoglycan-binding domain